MFSTVIYMMVNTRDIVFWYEDNSVSQIICTAIHYHNNLIAYVYLQIKPSNNNEVIVHLWFGTLFCI